MDCNTPGFPVLHSCPLSWWHHPTISSSAVPFSSWLQSFPASRSFPMSWLFGSGGKDLDMTEWLYVLSLLKVKVKSLSRVRLCDPMDCSPPGSSVHGSFRQEYWSELLFPTPGDLLDPGIKLWSLASPALADGFFTTEHLGSPFWILLTIYNMSMLFVKIYYKCAADIY